MPSCNRSMEHHMITGSCICSKMVFCVGCEWPFLMVSRPPNVSSPTTSIQSLTFAASRQQLRESVLPVYCSVASGHRVVVYTPLILHTGCWVTANNGKIWCAFAKPSHRDMLAAKLSANQRWRLYQTWHIIYLLQNSCCFWLNSSVFIAVKRKQCTSK